MLVPTLNEAEVPRRSKVFESFTRRTIKSIRTHSNVVLHHFTRLVQIAYTTSLLNASLLEFANALFENDKAVNAYRMYKMCEFSSNIEGRGS